MSSNRYIGGPVERLENPRFLQGKGTYVGDLSRPGLLHAAILRSSTPHGRIRTIEAAAALALPGVRTVITAAEIGVPVPRIPLRLHPLPVLEPYHQPVIAEKKVRYVGEPIVVVVADSAAIAEDALEAIRVEIEQLPPVVDLNAAKKGDAALFQETGANLAIKYTALKGDPDDIWGLADYVRRERFAVQRHTAVTMEPRGVLAEWDATRGRLTVSGASKMPFVNRRILAQQMGLPEDAIDMVENDVGGGFGVRGEFYPEDFLIPFAARFTGRPVKWIENRREHLIAANHARKAECELQIACRYDGTILALAGNAYVDLGAYTRTNGMVGARNIAQFVSGPYRISHIRIEVALLLTNKTPVGTYRGPGRFEADFFRERLFDIVARDLGIDPGDFRRRNLVGDPEMPYAIATITPYEQMDALDSGDYRLTLDRCLEEIDWAEKAKLQGKLVHGRYLGSAIGCFIGGSVARGPGGKSIAFAELARDEISTEESFANSRHAYSYGAHAAHVAVDPQTGRVEVLDYVAVADAGRIINPMSLKGQIVGAIVQGLGGALLEYLVYNEEGQLLTGSLADYLLPTADDFPRIRAFVTEMHPSPINPLGAKGAGDGGIIPVGGVIANAVASALASLNVQPRELPLSPPRIWQLIEVARAARRRCRK